MYTYGEIFEARKKMTCAAQHITEPAEQYAAADLYDLWDSEHLYAEGEICRLQNGQLWRRRKGQKDKEIYPPSVDTAALWELIPDPRLDGSREHPYEYAPGMAINNGKYYTEGGIIYRCTRDSGNPLYHALSAVVGLYVEAI